MHRLTVRAALLVTGLAVLLTLGLTPPLPAGYSPTGLADGSGEAR